jgi:hypothetical protein
MIGRLGPSDWMLTLTGNRLALMNSDRASRPESSGVMVIRRRGVVSGDRRSSVAEMFADVEMRAICVSWSASSGRSSDTVKRMPLACIVLRTHRR